MRAGEKYVETRKKKGRQGAEKEKAIAEHKYVAQDSADHPNGDQPSTEPRRSGDQQQQHQYSFDGPGPEPKQRLRNQSVHCIRHGGEERYGERDPRELKKDGRQKIQRNQEANCEQQGISSHRKFVLFNWMREFDAGQMKTARKKFAT